MGWYIFGGIVALIIAGKFANIASEKGYSAGKYGWLCFFLGPIGWCMVAALPDLILHDKVDRIHERLAMMDSGITEAEVTAVLTEDGWRCSCGREHPAYESSCICGTSKRDALRNKE